MSRYLLVNSEEALESFSLLFRGSLPDDTVFVAPTSAGVLACERAQVPYTTLDSYSPRAAIINLGWHNYASLALFCERWDATAQGFTPGLKNRGIKPFRFSYYDLKILVDSISIKLLMLKNFIQHAAGHEIFYLPEPDHQFVKSGLLRPRSDVNMFSVLLEVLLNGEARFSPLSSCRPSAISDLQSSLRSWRILAKKQLKTVWHAIRNLQLFRWNNAYGRYLCFNFGHDISYVVPHLLRRQLRLTHPPLTTKNVTPEAVEECNSLWLRLLEDNDFREWFSHGETSYFSLVKGSLSEYIRLVLPQAIADYDHLCEILPKFDIRFSLTGTINLGLIKRCHMLAAQASGAPLITYQEGAGYGSIISPVYDFTEILDGDAMLCYGTGNGEYYKDFGTIGKLLIPVGSAHQDAVRKGLRLLPPPDRIRTVMYVGTVVEDNLMHCPNNGLVSTFYFSTQIKIFRLMASLAADMRIIAKPNPYDAFTPPLLQLAEFKRIQIETRRFEKVMPGVDLFILDFPSTVLLSCIATTAYVFVLAEEGVTGFTQKQKERLAKRAYIFEDIGTLASAVRDISVNTAQFPLRLDDSYLMAYSLYLPDGNPAERAAEVLSGFSRSENLQPPRTQ